MKMILKIFALPVLLLVKVIWLLGNMITNIISYAIGFLLLIIGGCAIYCIVKAMWTSLAILIGMGMAVYLFLFLLVWSVVKAENIGNALRAFQTVDKVPAKAGLFYIYNRFSGIIGLSERRCFL